MEEFNKLTIDEQRKFIINKIISDKYFSKIHRNVKDNYCEYILEGDTLVKYKLELNNRRNAMHISNALKNYEHAVDKVMAEYSRYKDVVYDVYSCKETIEAYCKSKYINGMNRTYNPYYIFYDIIYCYYNTLSTIGKYGGEQEGNEDQSLSKAITILVNNPYLCDGIKKDKSYKKYYNEFYNKTYDSNESDKYDSSDEDTEDIVSADEVELSDIDNNSEGNDNDDD
jgi:conjugal transfer/entry exclusion protein